MSNEVGELGLTAKQLEVMNKEIQESETPQDVAATMNKFAKLSEENEVLARADQIKSGRAEPEPSNENEGDE